MLSPLSSLIDLEKYLFFLLVLLFCQKVSFLVEKLKFLKLYIIWIKIKKNFPPDTIDEPGKQVRSAVRLKNTSRSHVAFKVLIVLQLNLYYAFACLLHSGF